MESAMTGTDGSSTVITRRPFFNVVSLKSTRTLRVVWAWPGRAATTQINRGNRNLETRLIDTKTPLGVDDGLRRAGSGPPASFAAWWDCMRCSVECQADETHESDETV